MRTSRLFSCVEVAMATLVCLATSVQAPPHRGSGTDLIAGPTPSMTLLSPDPSGLPNGTAGWWEQASHGIDAMEYRITETPRGLQAPNRAHGLRTYFGPAGIEVVPRRDEGRSWKWTWSTRAFGREGVLAPLGPSIPCAERAGVRYAREGFVEWYVNGVEGVEQGFTIDAAPSGNGPICVDAVLGGDLRPLRAGGGETIDFVDGSGAAVLRYGKLACIDASGRRLESRFTLAGRQVRLMVEDRQAVFPITIDPLIESPAWQFQGEQERELLGRAISTAGDVNGDGFSDVIISAARYDIADSNEGRVFVFHGSPTGLSTEPDWIGDGDRPDALFGLSASTAGDVNGDGYQDIIIGAPMRVNDDGSMGSVYVYYGSAAGLTTPGWVSTCTSTELSSYGSSAGCAGDVNGDGYDDIVFGAPRYTDDQIEEGRVWIFLGSTTGIQPTPVWTIDGNQESSFFGGGACSAGDVNADGYADILVSAEHYNVDALPMAGRVYLYLGSASGPSLIPAWTADGEGAHMYFGLSVSMAGDVDGDGFGDVLVSSLYSNPDPLEGRALLYRGCPTGLEATPAWSEEGENEGAYFGYPAATAGDVNGDGLGDVIVGAPYHSVDGQLLGRAYLYLGSRSGLPSEPSWYVQGTQSEAYFGMPVATAGDVNGDGFSDLLVAASLYTETFEHEGRVYLYLGSGDGPREVPGWVIESNQAEAKFGYSVANGGDVNGDGYDDLFVSAPGFDNGQVDEGAAFLFFGHSGGASFVPDWYAESNQAGAFFGRTIAGAGDTNGDGYDDLIVGAPLYDETFVNEGKSFLWLGTPGVAPMGNPSNAAWSAAGAQAGALCGQSVSTAGDVNGDGFADVAIGAPAFSAGQGHEGIAAVYLGSESGLSPDACWITQSNQADASYGYAVAGAGDVNGDGYSDLLVGAPNYADGEPYEGAACLYYGYSAGLRLAPAWIGVSNQEDARFGTSVASAGDVNGDGLSDILVGAPTYTLSTACGIACLWLGSSAGPIGNDPTHCDWMSGTSDGSQMGASVAGAGDVDGDGFSDIIIGIPRESDPTQGIAECGAVLFLHGSADGVAGESARKIYGAQTGGDFGLGIASADVNGDGFSDLLIGAPWHSQGQTAEGRAFVYYGNDSKGLARAPDQLRPDLTAPVGLFGKAHSEGSIGLRVIGRTPAGRANVWMEWEVKPFGVRLDGSGIGQGTARNTGAPVEGIGCTVALTEIASGLAPAAGQHWRLRIASKNPWFPHTPWFSPSGNAPTEMDFRTEGTPSDAAEAHPVTGAISIGAGPNPWQEEARIRFELPAAGPVSLAVHDVRGRLVRRLVAHHLPAGAHEIVWDGVDDGGRPVGNGVYWVTLTAVGGRSQRQIVRTE